MLERRKEWHVCARHSLPVLCVVPDLWAVICVCLLRWAERKDCRADEEGAVGPDPEERTRHGSE